MFKSSDHPTRPVKPRTPASEQIDEVDVVGLGGQELWVGLRREYAASVEVEVDGVVGRCGGGRSRGA